MNFLGHAFFSGSDSEILAGNMFGDFVKGDIEQTSYSAGIKKGLLLHRIIDSRCEDIKAFSIIKSRIGKEFGHFRGVITDVFLDYLLATNWDKFSHQELSSFSESVLSALEKHSLQLPAGFQRIFMLMKRDKWLTRNKHISEIEGILRQMGAHFGRGIQLHLAIPVLKEHREEFNLLLPEFIAEMQSSIASSEVFTSN